VVTASSDKRWSIDGACASGEPDGESVALGGLDSEDGMDHTRFTGEPHSSVFPSYAAAGCAP
jgi:hypothetical protein